METRQKGIVLALDCLEARSDKMESPAASILRILFALDHTRAAGLEQGPHAYVYGYFED